MITLKYSEPSEEIEDGNKKEVTTTTVSIEDATPDQIAEGVRQWHDDNFEVNVSLRIKAPK